MTKYIIKNCLSYENGVCDNQDMFCQDCTDCVMKQIVKKCKKKFRSKLLSDRKRNT